MAEYCLIILFHLFQDSDAELLLLKKQFHKESLQYVFKLQEVKEKKKFEFVEYFVILMQVCYYSDLSSDSVRQIITDKLSLLAIER